MYNGKNSCGVIIKLLMSMHVGLKCAIILLFRSPILRNRDKNINNRGMLNVKAGYKRDAAWA